MKSKIGGVICAALLTAALPTMAFAASPSPTNTTTVTVTVSSLNDGTTSLSVTATIGDSLNNKIQLSESSTAASNYTAGTNDVFAVSYKLDAINDYKPAADDSLATTVNVGTQYAGQTVRVYIQNNDGTTEETTAVVASDGTITVSLKQLATFTVALAGGQTVAAGTTSTDKSAQSPKTGVDFDGAAGATVACAVAAGAVAYVYRRKVTE